MGGECDTGRVAPTVDVPAWRAAVPSVAAPTTAETQVTGPRHPVGDLPDER